jgi:hypothetical protein
MQMVDVLKRLAQLDATNPNVAKPTMSSAQSLATVSNSEGDPLAECGPMGMMGGMDRPSTPASFSINASAADGAEVSSMLSDILNLAGMSKDSPSPMIHPEIELEPAHEVEPEMGINPDHGADLGGSDGMSSMIGMIDKLNGPSDDDEMSVAQGDVDDDGDHDMADHGAEADSPVGKMADEVESMTAQLKDEGIGAGFDTATTTPDEKVHAHKYGNDQVTPKPQEPTKKAGGGNPYTEATIESVKAQLLQDYQQFVNESEKKTMSKAAKGMMKYGKDGMKALAKAGKDGKDLDKVRDKYNKYD